MPGKQTSIRHVSTPLPLDKFLSSAKNYYQTLEHKDRALLKAYRIFAPDTDISLEQYRQVSSLMQRVGETVEELCMLLSDAELLPPSARSYRYLPLMTFQYMNGQVQAILSSLASMRQLHKTSSFQKNRLKLLIHTKLNSLRQDLHEGLNHLRNLVDQTMLEEKRMNRPPSVQEQKPFVASGISHISKARASYHTRSSLDQANRTSWDVQID